MIEANNLQKYYKIKERKNLLQTTTKLKHASKNISIKIPKGKIIGVLGENGAGKTTLIKMLTTLLIPDSGTIKMNGKDFNSNLKEVRSSINMIAGGERNIYWRLNALENLEYFGSLYRTSNNQVKMKSEFLLKQLGLWENRYLPVERFSKGMKQRLQIAKGLINDPDYIFLDEPTLGLDIQVSKELRNIIKNLSKKENKGILLTTHYLAEAEELCDYIYIIDQGSVILEGTKEDIFTSLDLKKQLVFELENPFDSSLENTLDKIDIPYTIKKLSNKCILSIFSNELTLQESMNFFDNDKTSISKITQIDPSLEDALLLINSKEFKN